MPIPTISLRTSCALRPLTLIAASLLLFALAVQSPGLIVATIGLLAVSSVTQRGFRWMELAILGLTLSAFAIVGFTNGPGLPFQLI